MPDRYCNKSLLYETSSELKISEKKVAELIQFFTDQIGLEVRSGAMNGVMIPYLGKIQVKHELIQYKDFFHTLTPDQKKLFLRKENNRERVSEVIGKPQDNDEAICNQ